MATVNTLVQPKGEYPQFLQQMLLTLVEKLPAEQEPKTRKIVRDHMAIVSNQVDRLLDLKKSPDPMKSQLALDIAEESQRSVLNKVYSEAKIAINRAISEYKSSQQASRLLKSNLKPNEFAQEIRSSFRLLSMPQKLQVLSDAINSGDGALMAALTLDVPPMLTGLTPEIQEQYRESFLDKWSEVSFDYITGIEKTAETFLSSVEPFALPLRKEAVQAIKDAAAAEVAA